MALRKKFLFSGESDEEVDKKDVFKINKDYAKHHEQFRRKEELQRLKDVQARYNDYSSDSEDSDGVPSDSEAAKPTLQTFELLADVLDTINAGDVNGLKNKIKKKGNRKEKFKREEEEKAGYSFGNSRRQYLDRAIDGLEDSEQAAGNEEEEEPEEDDCRPIALLAEAGAQQGGEGEGLFPHKQKKQEGDQKSNVKQRLNKSLKQSKLTQDLKDVAEYIMSNLEALDSSDSEEDEAPIPRHRKKRERRTDDRDDQEEEETVIVYEDPVEETNRLIENAKHGFEEEEGPDASHAHRSYPSVLKTTVRTKDYRRKDERIRYKENKETEKRKIMHEINELKSMKMKEIKDRLALIKKVSGQTRLAFDEADLDEEFDADDYDRRMHEQYGEDYYGDDNDDMQKPQFEYDEAIDGDIPQFDDCVIGGRALKKYKYSGDGAEEREEEHFGGGDDDDDATAATSKGNVSQQGDPKLTGAARRSACSADDDVTEAFGIVAHSGKRKRRKRNKFLEALAQPKPSFDAAHHSLDQYYNEYYGLDCQDVIAGNIKCRFRYRTVEPNNFGLTTEEILTADDNDLNRWYSLKKLVKIDRSKEKEDKDRKVYRIKAENVAYKKKVMPTLFEPDQHEEEQALLDATAAQEAEEMKKKKKNLKKKLRKQRNLALVQHNLDSPPECGDSGEDNQQNKANSLEMLGQTLPEDSNSPDNKEKQSKKELKKQRLAEKEDKQEGESDNGEENKQKNNKRKREEINEDIDEEIPEEISPLTENKQKSKKRKREETIENEEITEEKRNGTDVEITEESISPVAKRQTHVTFSKPARKKDKKFTKYSKDNKRSESGSAESGDKNKKKKKKKKKEINYLPVGDTHTAVFGLSEARLAALNFTAISKVKYNAKYALKMAKKGVEVKFQPGDRKKPKKTDGGKRRKNNDKKNAGGGKKETGNENKTDGGKRKKNNDKKNAGGVKKETGNVKLSKSDNKNAKKNMNNKNSKTQTTKAK